jgi:hypothetical protein
VGASGWDYWVPYTPDVDAAFRRLREDVFRRGEVYRFDDEPVATIEELVEHNAESGTHSILDMERITETPDDGAVSPLRPDQLNALFGTETPTRAQIEATKDELVSLDAFVLASWTGVYIVAYRDGEPDELFFYGISGD